MKTILKDFIAPILALSLICLAMAGTLALINHVTEPIIAEAAADRALETMRELIPEADDFIRMEDNLLSRIHAIYSTPNNVGFIIVVNVRGFGGEMRVMNGIGYDGTFLGSYVLSHNETISFANRVFGIRDEYESRGESLLDVDAISGATVTFRAYQNALNYALSAFDIIFSQSLGEHGGVADE